MKIKEGFILREIVGSWIIVPVGQRVMECNGLISLSDSGALLWEKMEQDTDEAALVSLILDEYDTDEATARADVKEYLASLGEKGLIEQ